ncbi:hypothetical protein B0T26DRAFT_681330 [Lasiosphaeria miniovina]|uniref:Uncharacterized protein n=1 Tax=Lasiosphaeria miniovina TaxID=1954250 RepID=A0AA40DHU0_9PEZI|nr:uncharacterized protein B0T26DRAFT_681330 [Lasiosphaeria miniovina]KAK0703685.1 hypothetical protein B0T26DRAFT_681330 [Lasiosphaeria miniovina]
MVSWTAFGARSQGLNEAEVSTKCSPMEWTISILILNVNAGTGAHEYFQYLQLTSLRRDMYRCHPVDSSGVKIRAIFKKRADQVDRSGIVATANNITNVGTIAVNFGCNVIGGAFVYHPVQFTKPKHFELLIGNFYRWQVSMEFDTYIRYSSTKASTAGLSVMVRDHRLLASDGGLVREAVFELVVFYYVLEEMRKDIKGV